MTDLLFEKETYAIRGSAFEVYRELGCGFLEAVYQECMEYELTDNSIQFVAQKELALHYKRRPFKQRYVADLICCDKIVLEIKAVKKILPEHKAQLLNYLKSTGTRVGLLINFGSYPKATVERLVL